MSQKSSSAIEKKKKYRVVLNSTIFNDFGCGEDHEEIIGEYANLKEANDAARDAMENWYGAATHYGDRSRMENIAYGKYYDDGSFEEIHVVETSAHEEAKLHGD